MKKLLLSGILGGLLLACFTTGNAQDTFPQGFNYQAIARNATGSAIINTDMKVRIGILSDTITNTLVWEEEHTVRTNGYGLFSLIVGGPKGTRTGGSATTFGGINWAATQMFIYLQVKNPATAANFTPMGKARLWSVPYALLAGKSYEDMSSPFLFNGDTVYLTQNFAIGSNKPMKAQLAVIGEDDDSDDPLFEVRRKDGQAVFSVYSDAVTVNVPIDGKKGSPSRGGFAVGGYDAAKGTYVTDLFRVTPDSTRIYINNTPGTKGSPSRGGFAVGGFDESKAAKTELLRVTHDSTRIYTNESSDKGFAVGYLSSLSTRTENFMKLSKSNYLIGHQSGRAITTGTNNTFLGYTSGMKVTTGFANIFIGQESGMNTTEGVRNIFIGYAAGKTNVGLPVATNPTIGHDNIYIGTNAGRDIERGEHNTLIGSYSGYGGEGTKNTFVGAFTGFNATGLGNVFIGVDAGRNNNAGGSNVFLGAIAGIYNSGNNNTFLGYGAGWTGSATTGSGNVFVGCMAGAGQTGSNLLYIDNSSSSTPLIYGDFNNDRLALYGNVGINRTAYSTVSLAVSPNDQYYGIYVDAGSVGWAGYFNGDIRATVFTTSDERFKKNVQIIDSPVEKIKKINGVSFEWNNKEFTDKGFSTDKQMGLLAQEVEKVFPESVKTDQDGYKYVSYDMLTPVLIEAIKEQQKIIDKMKEEARAMDERIKKLENMILKLTEE